MRLAGALLLGVWLGLSPACGSDGAPSPFEARPADGETADPTETLSPSARPALHAGLAEDLAVPRHPSDGGGRAWLDDGDAAVRATPGRWALVYEAGPDGIAVGGAIYLQVSPFWGWSEPQDVDARWPGYTTVETEAEGVVLERGDASGFNVRTAPLIVRVGGRALKEGEQVRIVYGAGAAGAVADRYAERDSRFWIAVDGDGDGVRKILAGSPGVDVAAGPPAGLVLTVESTASPGAPARLVAAILDVAGDAGVQVEGDLEWVALPEGVSVRGPTAFAADDEGVLEVEVVAARPGTYRLQARGPGGLNAISNPLRVGEGLAPLLWGDLHGHSNLSDGTGVPEDYYRYARDVAALDVAVLTDHDHWGLLFLDEHPEMWEVIREQTQAFHEPGRFVTLLGYEWTSWLHGHRHVLYFSDEGEVFSTLDERYETPAGLWGALASRDDALTVAHHSAGGPVATNWNFVPDPRVEPVTEIMSVHGSSEAMDAPNRIYSPVPGNFVRDVLDAGLRFGFIGSGDGHDGHPGMAHLGNQGRGGLAAFVGAERTRADILDTLRARKTYATSGARILLEFDVDGVPLGGVLTVPTPGRVATWVAATAPLDRVELIHGALADDALPAEAGGGARHVIHRLEMAPGDDVLDVEHEWVLPGLASGEYVYLRVIQRNGAMAWSSPVFIE